MIFNLVFYLILDIVYHVIDKSRFFKYDLRSFPIFYVEWFIYYNIGNLYPDESNLYKVYL